MKPKHKIGQTALKHSCAIYTETHFSDKVSPFTPPQTVREKHDDATPLHPLSFHHN